MDPHAPTPTNPLGLAKGHSRTGTLRTGDTAQRITMQGELSGSKMHTVQFHVITSTTTAKPIHTEAIITWFVQGNTVIRRVSVGDGTSVSGTGEQVHVAIYDATVGLIPGQEVDYIVSCQVAMGVRPNVQQPATLNPIPGFFQIPAGGFIDVPVPDDAGVISVYTTAWESGLGVVPFAVVEHQLAAGVQKIYNPTVIKGWVPLAPGSDNVRLVNQGANPIFFSITFGIDG